MGITINHRLGQKKVYVKRTLDVVENVAKQIQKNQASVLEIPFEIKRHSDFSLFINIGGCETLAFDFKSVKEINDQAKNDFSYEYAVLTDDGAKKLNAGYAIDEYPENEIYYCANFCKTQFSEKLVEHKLVADLLKIVASKCVYAEVNDEGEYYHSGDIEDAADSIESLGKEINKIAGMLGGNVIVDDSKNSKIKRTRKKKAE